MNTPELRRAKDKLARVEPVLYVRDDTASLMGLQPEDIVHPDVHGGYVMLRNKQEILDLQAIKEEFSKKRRTAESLNRPVVSVAPDGQTPTLLVVDAQTEPEEVQDILGETYEKNEARLRKENSTHKQQVIDTGWVRYVNKMPQADEFSDLYKQALRDRVTKHKQNPVTDPPHDPYAYSREHGMIPPQVSVPDNYEVKEPACPATTVSSTPSTD